MSERPKLLHLPTRQLFNIEVAKPEMFTERQVEILNLILKGEKTENIAKKMGISRLTVKNYICGIGSSLGKTKIELGILGIARRETGVEKISERTGMILPLLEHDILKLVPIQSGLNS